MYSSWRLEDLHLVKLFLGKFGVKESNWRQWGWNNQISQWLFSRDKTHLLSNSLFMGKAAAYSGRCFKCYSIRRNPPLERTILVVGIFVWEMTAVYFTWAYCTLWVLAYGLTCADMTELKVCWKKATGESLPWYPPLTTSPASSRSYHTGENQVRISNRVCAGNSYLSNEPGEATAGCCNWLWVGLLLSLMV